MMNLALPLIKIRLFFRAVSDICFPSYSGSTFRGAFGIHLRESFCSTLERKCCECNKIGTCVYAGVFEGTRVLSQEGAESVSVDVPNAYVIEPLPIDRDYVAAGGVFSIDIILFGKVSAELNNVVTAFIKAGFTGFTESRGRAELIKVCQIFEDDVRVLFDRSNPSVSGKPVFTYSLSVNSSFKGCRIILETPLRIVHKKKNISAENFTPGMFLNGIIRRVRILLANHAEDVRNSGSDLIRPYCPDSENYRCYSGLGHVHAETNVSGPQTLTGSGERSDTVPYYAERRKAELEKLPEWSRPFFEHDDAELSSKLDTIVINNRKLHWFDWARLSSRQQRKIKLGGIMGSFELEGDLELLALFIRAGEIMHAGKAAVMGLGKYRTEWF